MNAKKLCVVTTTRAEYGLLKHLMHDIRLSKNFKLQLLVSGTHLSSFHGNTIEEIKNDGFDIDAEVDLELHDDSSTGIAKSASLALEGFTKTFQELNPDLIILLGDRFEILSAAIAGMFSKTPIAHMCGGEVTEGAIDEGMRHAISKLSHFHFVANDVYKKRVIQLGEDPKDIFNVGGLGVDAIAKIKLLSKSTLEKELNFLFKEKNLLITFHPETISNQKSEDQLFELLNALSTFNDIRFIFTMPNADPDSRSLHKVLEDFVKSNNNSVLFDSLGQLRYFSCMAIVDGVIGNSSSGIAETPSFKIPTVNIGDRQKGRLKASSVIDCGTRSEEITTAINRIYDEDFRANLQLTVNPYGDGGATTKIMKILQGLNLKDALKKSFRDLSHK